MMETTIRENELPDLSHHQGPPHDARTIHPPPARTPACRRARVDHLTQQAVWALQKAADLKADGVVGPKTHRALDRDTRPRPTIRSGTAFEVDLSEQLLMCISGGRLTYILNTSTGSGKRYYSGGRWKTATTPKGDFSMFRFPSRGWQRAPLGTLYRPGYYDRGWAVHGSTSIPPYPASHGCSRISTAACDHLWDRSWFRKGRRVLIHS